MQPKRVALLVETSSTWGSQIIAGVSDFVRQHERWVLFVDHRGVFEQQTIPTWWEGDGIVARLTSPNLAQHIRQAAVPCVNVSLVRIPGANVQHVTLDENRVGEIAAESLLNCGLRHFGYYGPPQRDFYVDAMLPAFEKVLRSAGLPLSVHQPDRLLRSDTDPHLNLQELSDWVKSLPKPCGILAWNSLGAHRVTEACCWAELRIPQEIAVVAGENDYLVAEIATPRLTCVDQAPRRVGYLAAAELHRLMSGGTINPPVRVEPHGVVFRESTPQAIIRDQMVAESVAFIEANIHRNISITDLIDHVPASRRNLEVRFRRALGRGPAAEIRRLRLSNACRLLSETDLPIKQIALRCGFTNPEQLQRQLRSQSAMTPTRYRKMHHRQTHLGTLPPQIESVHPGSG